MADTTIGKGVLQVGFDSAQVKQAGETQLLPTAKELAMAVGGAFAAIKIGGFAKGGIDELKQAGVVTAQTASQLRITGGAAGVTAKQIDDLGQSMLDLAGFDDEAARSAANVFLRFDRIVGEGTFTRAEKDAADLAITLGTTLPAAAEILGKALQDPDKAARLLRPAIGQLSAAQQDSIKYFLEQNDVAGAQGVIFAALEGKIGGAAAAFGDTLAGSEAKATEELKNMKASLTEGLAPALKFTYDRTVDFAHIVEGLPGPLRAVGGAAAFAGGEVLALSQPVAALVSIYGRHKDSALAAAAASRLLTAAETEEAVATGALTSTQLAREAVEAQVLLSNYALTASDEALAVAEGEASAATAELAAFEAAYAGTALEASAATEGATVASGGMLATLGPLGLAAGLAAGALTVMSLVSDDGAKAAKALDEAVTALDSDLANLGGGSTKTLTADLQHFLDQLVGAKDGGEKYRDILNSLGITTNDLAVIMGKGSQAAGEWIQQLALSGAVDESDLRILGELVQKTADHAQATLLTDVAQGKLTQTQLDAAAATHLNAAGTTDWTATLNALQGTITGTTAGTSNLTAAQAKLEDAFSASISASRQAFDADRAYASAQKGVETALQGVADAQRRVADAQHALNLARQGASESDLEHGALSIESANLRVADSAQAIVDEQKKLDLLRRQNRSTPEELAAQERRVEEANIAHSEAILGVTDAEDRLQELQRKGTSQDEAVISAKRALVDAQDSVRQASDRVEEAYLTQADASAKAKDAQYNLANGTLTANVTLTDQLTAFQALSEALEPNSPLRKNIDDYIATLLHAKEYADLQAAQGQFAAAEGDVPTHATGGWAAGGELFEGGERGWELGVIPKRGRYQSPPQGMGIIDHLDSAALAGMVGSALGRGGGDGIVIHGGVNVRGENAPDALRRLPGTLRQSVTLARR